MEKFIFKITSNLIKIIIIAVAVLFILLIFISFLFKGSKKINLSGYINPEKVMYIRPQVSGIIKNIYIRENMKVSKAQLLLEIDDFELQKQYENLENEVQLLKDSIEIEEAKFKTNSLQARHKVQQTRAEYEYTKMELDKLIKENEIINEVTSNTQTKVVPYKIRLKRKLLNSINEKLKIAIEQEKEVKLLSFGIDELRNRLENRTNQLLTIKNRIEKSKIHSPISGYVLGSDIEKFIGTYVNEGDTLFSVADFSKWVIQVQIPENKISKVSVGLPAKIYINAVPYMDYQLFEGRVKEISISPIIHPQFKTISYKGIIEITDPDFNKYIEGSLIKPGMRADIKVILQKDKIIKLIFKKFVEEKIKY